MSRNWGMHDAEALLHRSVDSWLGLALLPSDGFVVYPALI
jgi:hypothetical protein